MIVYRSLHAARKYRRGGAGIVSSPGAMVAKYATRAMLTSAAKISTERYPKDSYCSNPSDNRSQNSNYNEKEKGYGNLILRKRL